MECIECGTNNRLSDRTKHQGFCKKCQHPFAFEPISMTGTQITDRFFADVINVVSSDNTVFFTSRQLLYGLNKRLKKVGISDLRENNRVILPLVSVSIAFSFLSILELTDLHLRVYELFYWLKGNLFLSVSFGLFLLPFIILIRSGVVRKTSVVEVTQYQLTEWIRRWQTVNSPIAKLLPEPRKTSSATIDPEIEAYSFDRAIICDCAEVAQLLIANNLHFENNCAILSVTGYPQSIFATVMEMLRRNPELSVYALHDASCNGVCLIHTL